MAVLMRVIVPSPSPRAGPGWPSPHPRGKAPSGSMTSVLTGLGAVVSAIYNPVTTPSSRGTDQAILTPPVGACPKTWIMISLRVPPGALVV